MYDASDFIKILIVAASPVSTTTHFHPMEILPRRLLTSHSLPVVLVLLALALSVPSIFNGWQQDDLVHRYTLLGNPDITGRHLSPLQLFDFVDGDTSRTHLLIDSGLMPWWTFPAIRLSFWRPLSSLTHWVDYLLWPQNSVLMHLQSLFWLGAVVLVAASLYRRLMGKTWVAGLAALFFAVDHAHGLPVGWIANRNALVAGFFGVTVLVVHDRWRKNNWKAGAILGPVLLLLALLSGESALAVCAYLFGYALFLDEGDRPAKTWSLAPYAVVALAWLVTYSLLGYGVSGSGFYVDPLSEPADFLLAVIKKAPVLLADQLALPPSSITLLLTDNMMWGLCLWGVVLLTFLAYLVIPIVRRDRMAKFWATGMLLSIPLACLTMPHSRLLLFSGLGAFGLLAQWIAGVREEGGWRPASEAWNRSARPMVAVFLFIHTILSALLFVFDSRSATFGENIIQKPAVGVEAGDELASQDLVIVNHPMVFYGNFFSTARMLRGLSVPRHLRILAPATERLQVFRPDVRTLVIRAAGGFLGAPFDNVFRGLSHPMHSGRPVALTGMTATTLELMPDGRPAAVAFRFAVPLEAPSLRWLAWGGGRFVAFVPPAVGETVEMPSWKLTL